MKVTPELIKKYHQNLCSEEERQMVELWLQETSWENETYAEGEENLSPVFEVSRSRVQGWKKSLSIAASLFLVSGLTWIGFNAYKKPEECVFKAVSTQKGEIKQIDLADGTRVFLNAESTIEYPEKFADTARDVKLTGEAYFEVAKDPKRRFRIETDQSELKVLGTEFNLKAYKGENQELSVTEGKVSFSTLQSDSKPQVLVAREFALLETSTGIIESRTEKIEMRDHWRDGGLTINDLSVKELIPILERRFGLEVNVKNPALLKKNYTGSHKAASVRAVMEDICFVLNCNYKVTESKIEIY